MLTIDPHPLLEALAWWYRGRPDQTISALHLQSLDLAPAARQHRAAILARLVSGQTRVLVASRRSFVTPVPPPAEMTRHVFSLARGQSIDPQELGDRLASGGYLRVPRVALPAGAGTPLSEPRLTAS